MQATQTGTEKQLARTAVSLQNSMAAVASLEKDLSAAGEKFTFLQDMRAYIADLCDMLQVCPSTFSSLQPRCFATDGTQCLMSAAQWITTQ